MPLAVRIWGLDSEGKVFSQNARTLDITASGARLYGVKANLPYNLTMPLRVINVLYLGRVDYSIALELQQTLVRL
ncbi:MAG TPA: hypothetical protein VGP89_16900 [Candidatus Angelobacter sp.]|nr:hypothetical protein [Candidatus Angelobacter sp.]